MARHTKKELLLIKMARRVLDNFDQKCGPYIKEGDVDPDTLDVMRDLYRADLPYRAEFPDYRGLT